MQVKVRENGRETAPPALPLYALAPEAAIDAVQSRRTGLSLDEARERLRRAGPNVLQRARADGPWRILWRQVNNPLIWVLVASGIVAVALGKVTDGLVVLAVVVANTCIGFVQEYRAGRALEALLGMVPEHAAALRDERRTTVPVSDLVPGDVVFLSSGDKVPADMRLLEVKHLQVEEAALTGESLPVNKQVPPVPAESALGDRASMVFGGTLVSAGTATGIVSATGTHTELGRISTLLAEATDLDTPLTRAIGRIGRQITAGILAVAALMLVAGTWREMARGTRLTEALRDTAMFAIALAVGAIPEGLPAIVTIALAIGVQRMARRRAIVRKLPAVETLGSTTVICSDKTGTLTRNEMTVQAVWSIERGECLVTGVGFAPVGTFVPANGAEGAAPDDVRHLLLEAVLCSDASLHQDAGGWRVNGDPTEGALVVAAVKAGIDPDEARRTYARHDVIPFESEHQFMATLTERGASEPRLTVKGAPETVLERCAGVDRRAVDAEVEQMASRGMRVLAVAGRALPDDQDLTMADVEALAFVGLVGMIDPPRPEAVDAVRRCQQAGIAVKMITGDHKGTAEAIGRELHLPGTSGALTGAALAAMDDEALRAAARQHHVFARVAPEHKLRLVRALQHDGHVVAMTGDGVNDAPALKQADIGVAMGISGTSVSKEAADVVLTDDNFATIAAAVEEGRRTYDNLVKSLAFVLPTNLGLAMILVTAVLFFPFDATTGRLLLPMLPTQLLWINLVATVALALPLAFEAREPQVMRRPPRDPQAAVLDRFVAGRTVVASVLMTAGAVGLFLYEAREVLAVDAANPTAIAKAQTMAVTTVIMFQIFYLLNCRSLQHSMLAIGLFSNRWVFAGIAAVLALQTAFIYTTPLQRVFGTTPLGARDLILSAAVGASILPVISVIKRLERGSAREAADLTAS